MTAATPQPDPNLTALPRAAVLMLWTAAYLHGDIGSDDAAELAHGAGRHAVSRDSVDLFDWATGLRRLPLADARLVLPRPGRLAGLVGPPAAITDAIGSGQAIVVTAGGMPDHSLIPVVESLHTYEPLLADGPVEPSDAARARGEMLMVRWLRHAAPVGAAMPPPATGAARAELLEALQSAADASIALDLVPEEPIPAARIPHGWIATGLPRHLEQSDIHLLILAARTLLLVEDELVDPVGGQVADGGPITSADADARRRILEELRDAAGAALVESVDLVLRRELQRL